jgi:hypothetical protein
MNKTTQQKIKEGCGYFDTTTKPYGGDFRRSDGSVLVVRIIKEQAYKGEHHVELEGNRFAYVRPQFLES